MRNDSTPRRVRIQRFTAIRQAIQIFPKRDQKRIGVITLVQIFLGLLDLLGVALFGILGALAVNGIQSHSAGNRVQSALHFLHLGSLSFQKQIAVLGIGAAILLIVRTLVSVFFTRRILFYLSRKSAEISSNLVSRLFSQNLLEIQSRTSQEVLYAILAGVNTISLGIVGTLVALATDLSLFLIMTAGLFLVDPIMAIGTFTIFLVTGFLLHQLMNKRAVEIGSQAAELSVRSNEMILEVMNSYREAIVRNRRSYYVNKIRHDRMTMASNTAEISFFPYISKYVFETVVIVGGLAIAAIQFLTQDATHAVAILAVFMAAGTRIAPAVLRLQQGAIQIKSSIGSSIPTLKLISELDRHPALIEETQDCAFSYPNFVPSIELKNINFTYPGKAHPTISEVSLLIPAGSSAAFVGPSGAGKTTLVDIILGLLNQSSGKVKISGMQPNEVTKCWPGAVSYVPQDVMIVNGTIRENVSLGFPGSQSDDSDVNRALAIAQLLDFVNSLPEGIDTVVGERGARMSGGQRQRLGIARALFTKPKLLVLDEATSSLDGITEKGLSNSIAKLQGEVTVVLIAHRLTTVRNVDQVVYLDNGQVLASGTFAEVRRMVPDFDAQASLLG
jgi:ABC-type multidrug transport system fused ATPase/permease subunit